MSIDFDDTGISQTDTDEERQIMAMLQRHHLSQQSQLTFGHNDVEIGLEAGATVTLLAYLSAGKKGGRNQSNAPMLHTGVN